MPLFPILFVHASSFFLIAICLRLSLSTNSLWSRLICVSANPAFFFFFVHRPSWFKLVAFAHHGNYLSPWQRCINKHVLLSTCFLVNFYEWIIMKLHLFYLFKEISSYLIRSFFLNNFMIKLLRKEALFKLFLKKISHLFFAFIFHMLFLWPVSVKMFSWLPWSKDAGTEIVQFWPLLAFSGLCSLGRFFFSCMRKWVC